MRTWPVALLLLAGALGTFAACGSTPAISVIRGDALRTMEPVQGDPLKIKRGAQEGYAGARGGYSVVRTEEDVKAVWSGHDLPASARPSDPDKRMLIVAVPEAKDVVKARIERVLETGSFVHVFVRETKRGLGCVARSAVGEEQVYDVVTVDRIDKPMRFYVEEDQAETCGEPPAVGVKCRLQTKADWSEKLAAQPGDVVECEVTAESRGKFAVVDRGMSVGELPGGSTAKLTFTKGPTRATFPVDVFGTFKVRGEATDESGRKASVVATIEAAPPNTKDVLVQLVWTNFDASDDPETFPRVKLRALDEGAKRECAVDAPSDTCEVRTRSAYTHMKLKGAAPRSKISVSYTDERVEKGPVVCVQVYFEGKRTAEACDRKGRQAEERWEVGTIDRATGAFETSPAPFADGGAPSSADADGGAPKGDASVKPAPKAPQVKGPAKPTPPKPVEKK